MPTNHVVQQGECVNSIAKKYGHFWETLWNDPANSELKQLRKDPNVLLEGDELSVMDLRPHEESKPDGQKHRFRRKGVPAELNLRLLDKEGNPRAGLAYTLDIDGKLYKGKLDSEGRLKQAIPPDARSGKLIVGEGDQKEEYELQLGGVDPIDTVSGVKGRLLGLGYYRGAVDNELDQEVKQSIRLFQQNSDMEPTGELDDATRDKLKSVFGS